MTDLSNLLKEAKPLYYKRKKRNQRIQKVMFSVFILFTVLVSGYSGYSIKSASTQYIAGYDISDTFVPLDDYGLITVEY